MLQLGRTMLEIEWSATRTHFFVHSPLIPSCLYFSILLVLQYSSLTCMFILLYSSGINFLSEYHFFVLVIQFRRLVSVNKTCEKKILHCTLQQEVKYHETSLCSQIPAWFPLTLSLSVPEMLFCIRYLSCLLFTYMSSQRSSLCVLSSDRLMCLLLHVFLSLNKTSLPVKLSQMCIGMFE